MIVLGLDTSTTTASCALLAADGDVVRVLAETGCDTAGRSARLLGAIDDACRAAGVTPRTLDAIAVGAGPGSFTGLRIGMATAKGIAFAAGRPLWAVSSLAALSLEAGAGRVAAVLDARRGEVFAGVYDDGRPVAQERVMAPDALAAWLDELGAGAIAGDALAAYPVLAPLADRWRPATPRGVAVARLALAGARIDVLVTGAPTYIRPAEAELKYPDGVPGALRTR